jgi:multidrug efflux system membrane fusion protein
LSVWARAPDSKEVDMKKPLPRWTALSLLVLLAACGQKAAAPEPERAVRTQVLQVTQAGQEMVYAAEVRARSESRLGFRVPGKVLERKVGLGDSVKKGQVLMRLDPSDLALAAEAAQAQLRAAKTNRDSLAADLKRFRDLHAQGFIGAAELERRDAAFQGAQAQWEQARAQARAQANQADYGALKADVAGIITSVDAEPGTVVAAGTPVLRLAQDGPLDVVFQIPEQQAAALRRIAADGDLQVRVAGLEAPLSAKLREVAQAADPVSRTFLVKADIGKPSEVKLGQTATVTLNTAKVSGVLKLPMSAVFQAKGQPHVWVLNGGTMTVRQYAVQVAGAEGNEVVVTGGLSPEQEIVTVGVHVLREGEKVRRYGAPAAPIAAASR